MPILDDVLHELSSSKVFTKVDLQNGYWHVQLDEESSLLTTFQTCFGRFRFLQLPFGLNVSAKIFERKIRELFGDMRDDIIIHGKTKKEHDDGLKIFIAKCDQFGVKLKQRNWNLPKTPLPSWVTSSQKKECLPILKKLRQSPSCQVLPT